MRCRWCGYGIVLPDADNVPTCLNCNREHDTQGHLTAHPVGAELTGAQKYIMAGVEFEKVIVGLQPRPMLGQCRLL